EILKLNFIENGAFDKFFGAEAIIDNRPGFEILHARLHGPALVSGRAVLRAEHGEKLALVLDDHAGAKLCGLDAAHRLPEKFRFRKFRRARMVASSGMTCLPQLPCSKQGRREARRRLVSSSAKQQYKWLDSARSITAFFALSRFRRWLRHRIAFDCFRSEEHTSELQSRFDLVCRLL